MLRDLFPALCAGPVPAGADIWEISRLVTNPAGAAGTSILRVHRLLALALLEFAHEGAQFFHARDGHGVVEAGPHAADRLVALQLQQAGVQIGN